MPWVPTAAPHSDGHVLSNFAAQFTRYACVGPSYDAWVAQNLTPQEVQGSLFGASILDGIRGTLLFYGPSQLKQVFVELMMLARRPRQHGAAWRKPTLPPRRASSGGREMSSGKTAPPAQACLPSSGPTVRPWRWPKRARAPTRWSWASCATLSGNEPKDHELRGVRARFLDVPGEDVLPGALAVLQVPPPRRLDVLPRVHGNRRRRGRARERLRVLSMDRGS